MYALSLICSNWKCDWQDISLSVVWEISMYRIFLPLQNYWWLFHHWTKIKSTFCFVLNDFNDYFYIQISYHSGPVIDSPDKRDDNPGSHTSQMVSEFIQKHFIGIKKDVAIMEACMYTVTVSLWLLIYSGTSPCTIEKKTPYKGQLGLMVPNEELYIIFLDTCNTFEPPKRGWWTKSLVDSRCPLLWRFHCAWFWNELNTINGLINSSLISILLWTCFRHTQTLS